MIFDPGFQVLSSDFHDPVIVGDTASLNVRVNFKLPDGEEDGEGLHFELARIDCTWKITSLKSRRPGTRAS